MTVGGKDLAVMAAPAEERADRAAERVRSGAGTARGWADMFIIAFVLAMFIRLFLVEPFKIPTGSMSPTLVGGQVIETDYNGDGLDDMLLLGHPGAQLFLNDGARLVASGSVRLTEEDRRRWGDPAQIPARADRILVNKFVYWFHPPRRGDVVVFKVPPRIWNPDESIYIKRCVGEPGDRVGFDLEGRLLLTGRPVRSAGFFLHQRYQTALRAAEALRTAHEGRADYVPLAGGGIRIRGVEVPPDEIYVLGDNSANSRDSRYWGGVPLPLVRGRAFFRFMPLGQMRFLDAH